MKRPARGSWVVIALIAGLAGCRDVGLHDRNLPLEEAVNRQFGYTVYQAAENPPVAAAGRHWIRSLTVETIPNRLLVQVANADGTLLYARRGEQAPFGILYSPVSADRWSPWQRLN